MALNGYLTVEGDRQGNIEGDSQRSGYEGMMEIHGWSHEVSSPRDAATGLPTGRRQHKPLTVTKPVDKASPLLMGALTTNENLSSVVLRCVAPSADGSEEQYYTIELVNATVSNIRQEQLNNKYPENMPHEVREHVSFAYQRIVWVHEVSSTSAEDDWSDSRA